MASRRRRKWLIILAALAAMVIVVALTFPVWFPWALRPVASHFGVRYQEYRRVGKDKFALTEVDAKHGSIGFRAKRVEGYLPWKWKGALATQATNNPPDTFLGVDGWRLDIGTSTNKPPSTNTPFSLIQQFEKQAQQLNHWLPRATFANGVVHVKEQEFLFGGITLERGKIEGDVNSPRSTAKADFKGDISSAATNSFSIRVDTWDMRTRIRLTNEAASSVIWVTTNWKTNRLEANALLEPGQKLPTRAHIVSDGITVPANVLKADGYDTITIGLNGDWQTNGFIIDVKGHAQPLEFSQTRRPELNLEVGANGNMAGATLTKARVFAPWVDAHLNKPITVDYKGNMASVDVPFEMAAELDKQSWLPVKGHLAGIVLLNSGSLRQPNLRFDLKGQQIVGYGLDRATIGIGGEIKWPILTIGTGTFTQPNGATGTFSTQLNLETREINPSRIAFSGRVGESLLPAGASYQSLRASAEVSGIWPNLKHAGELNLENFSYAVFTNASASAKWQGTFLDLQNLEANLTAGTNSFSFAGATAISTTVTNITVRALEWRGNGESLFRATQPFALTVSAATNVPPTAGRVLPEILLKNLRVEGQGAILNLDAAVAWPSRANVQLSVTNLTSGIFQPLSLKPLPELSVPRLAINAAWDDGPLQLDLDGILHGVVRELGRVTSTIAMQSDETGLSIKTLTVRAQDNDIITAHGTLPATITPAGGPGKRFVLGRRKEVQFEATSVPNPKFWEAVARWTGVYLSDPRLQLTIAGKTGDPEGALMLDAREVHSTRFKMPLPKVENLHARATFSAKALELTTFDMTVDQQPLHVTGVVPNSPNLWRKQPKLILEEALTNATINVRANDVKLAPFAEYLPAILAPQGTAEVDVSIVPPLALRGSVTLKAAATRPLESVGPVREINGDLKFDGRTVRLERLSGEIGGAVVTITGTADVSDTALAEGFPGLDLHVKGERVPLARLPDMILRSDLDLVATRTNNSVPVITGSVTMRDSFFLSDLKFLVPGRLAKASRRPPYFSVEKEPYAQWQLDLRVRGERFMKVRSPFFAGEVSSNFRITGTLGDPIALGDATVNSGFVQFPFANLEVKQGLVTLAADNPHRPQLLVTAGSRAFGYELTMNVTGYADEPIIEFSSTPPLNSEEIVLMLTAGQLPRHELAFSTQQKAGALAMFVGKSLWAKFGADEPGAERLTVRSGEDISEQGRQTYSVEYKLSKRWSLVGEYDRFSALNAGVKWKIYSR